MRGSRQHRTLSRTDTSHRPYPAARRRLDRSATLVEEQPEVACAIEDGEVTLAIAVEVSRTQCANARSDSWRTDWRREAAITLSDHQADGAAPAEPRNDCHVSFAVT